MSSHPVRQQYVDIWEEAEAFTRPLLCHVFFCFFRIPSERVGARPPRYSVQLAQPQPQPGRKATLKGSITRRGGEI